MNLCLDWPVSGPCWPVVSSLTGQSCGRLWSPRVWPAQGWRPLLCTYPSYRRQHWNTTSSVNLFSKLLCFLQNRCQSVSSFISIDHWQRAPVYTSQTHIAVMIKIENCNKFLTKKDLTLSRLQYIRIQNGAITCIWYVCIFTLFAIRVYVLVNVLE